MDLKPPRPKKFCRTAPSLPLPVVKTSDREIHRFSGYFDGFSVLIENQQEMHDLNKMGFFGKANLSKSFPSFNANPDKTPIVRRRQFIKRNEWAATRKKPSTRKIIVVTDSDSEDNNYFHDLKPEYQIDHSFLRETLNLSLVEAYFLCHDVKCLSVRYENEPMDVAALWLSFSEADRFFAPKYIAYYHFRRKNWMTKPGIKFGGDFLLYQDGPPFYHASYVVIVDVLDENLKRREDLQIRSMEFTQLVGLNRLCETAGKELLICQLIWPRNVDVSATSDGIDNIMVNEVIMRRWISTKNNNALLDVVYGWLIDKRQNDKKYNIKSVD